MKRLEKIFLLLLTAVTVQTIVVANANAQADLMTRLDVDQDGFISLKEAVTHTELLRQFGLLDADEDGKLSMHELADSDLVKNQTPLKS